MIDAWLDLVHGGCCVGCGRRGRSLCGDCRAGLPTAAREVSPDPRPAGLAPCFAATAYDGVPRAMLLAHKERAVFGLRAPLAHCLAVALLPVLPGGRGATGTSGSTGVTVVVPVPSTARVVRARGHDPLLRVARLAAGALPRVEVATLLRQRGAAADQSGLGARERGRNREGTMAVREGVRARLARRTVPVSLVVVDDVLTTGSTAREAQRALEVAGLPVRAVCVVAATRRRAPLPRVGQGH